MTTESQISRQQAAAVVDSPVSTPAETASPPPNLLRLFIEFAKISVVGFGGVFVWARRAIVEKHRWMTADQFNEAFALSQFLPGPNIVNLAVIFGTRLCGPMGGVVIFLALLGPPVVIVIGVGYIYSWYGDAAVLGRILHGVSCAAVGLFSSAAIKMMMPMVKRRDVLPLAMMVLVFAAVGFMRWPMPYVLLVAVPAGLAMSYALRQRELAKAVRS